ncbi:hypothetical protein GCM10018952_07050 [Streptosporangium vulgare]
MVAVARGDFPPARGTTSRDPAIRPGATACELADPDARRGKGSRSPWDEWDPPELSVDALTGGA